MRMSFNTSGGDSGGPLISWPAQALIGILIGNTGSESSYSRWDYITTEVGVIW